MKWTKKKTCIIQEKIRKQVKEVEGRKIVLTIKLILYISRYIQSINILNFKYCFSAGIIGR
jgi:hypothetical protein